MGNKNTSNIIGAGKKEDRREMDFYPTPSDVTIALMDFLRLEKCTVWECACGDGAMAKVIARYGHNVITTDIRETECCCKSHDFLKHPPFGMCDAIITNPPFNIANKFILQALKLAPVVAMVLKSQYWHAASRANLFKKHPPAYILPLTWRPDFIGGGAPQMDILWTVWQKDDIVTKYKLLEKPRHQIELFS